METEASSALISTFAHDLRAPLRSMMMTVQRIQRSQEALSAETQTKLDEILKAARRQEELISSVVEYDQAQNPGLVDDGLLQLRLAIQTACMKVESYRQAKNGTITVDLEAVPRTLVPSGIARVIEKILHNSLKFQTVDATPVVLLEASQDEGGVINVRVTDNGIGIEAAYRDVVFEPFKRLNANSEFPGSGLGLSTCRRLISSVGGSIYIDDVRTAGTSLVMRFPGTRRPD